MKTWLKKLIESKNHTIHFLGDNKDTFYALYRLVESFADATETEYSGDYMVTTYQFKTGEIVKVWFNDNYGVFTKMEYVA